MNFYRCGLALSSILLAAGCANEGAIFVTKSSLSIFDVDSTPPEATIALQRVEGFIAPRNRNGDTPPVLAHLQANRAFFSPEVQQVYATGTAAERLAGDAESDNSSCETCTTETKQPVTFATSTTIGLRVGLAGSTNIIEGMVLGYRRKEMSFVPVLAKDADGTYHYPSLIAAIKLNDQEAGKTEFGSCQGFATGTAATALATSGDGGFGCLGNNQTVKQLLVSKAGSNTRQQAEIAQVLACYITASDERKGLMRADAQRLGLLLDAKGQELTVASADLGDLKTAALRSTPTDTDYAQRLLRAVDQVSDPTAASFRERLLKIHRGFACGDKIKS